jgi:hypothetical protein
MQEWDEKRGGDEGWVICDGVMRSVAISAQIGESAHGGEKARTDRKKRARNGKSAHGTEKAPPRWEKARTGRKKRPLGGKKRARNGKSAPTAGKSTHGTEKAPPRWEKARTERKKRPHGGKKRARSGESAPTVGKRVPGWRGLGDGTNGADGTDLRDEGGMKPLELGGHSRGVVKPGGVHFPEMPIGEVPMAHPFFPLSPSQPQPIL